MKGKAKIMSDSNSKVEVKKDCFAYKFGGECNILRALYCAGEHCKFYKTKEQLEKERKKL